MWEICTLKTLIVLKSKPFFILFFNSFFFFSLSFSRWQILKLVTFVTFWKYLCPDAPVVVGMVKTVVLQRDEKYAVLYVPFIRSTDSVWEREKPSERRVLLQPLNVRDTLKTWLQSLLWCFKALLVPEITQGLLEKLQVLKSDQEISKAEIPLFPCGRTIADDFAAFLAELLPGLDVPLLHFKGGCSGSGYTEMGGCWEPALLWEMLKQPAPGAAHTINIPGTGGVPQTILRNVWAGIQEQEFTGGRNLSDLSKPLQW